MVPATSINNHSEICINSFEKVDEEVEFRPLNLFKKAIKQDCQNLYDSVKYAQPSEKAYLAFITTGVFFSIYTNPVGSLGAILRDSTVGKMVSQNVSQLSFRVLSNLCQPLFLIRKDTDINERESPISILPRHVLVHHIFSLLNIKDQSNFQLVCKEWNYSPSFHSFAKRRWRPYRIALHLREVPDFTKRQSYIRIFCQIKETAKSVTTLTIANLASGQVARWAINYSNSLNQAFDQLPFEQVKNLMEAYNRSDFCYLSPTSYDDFETICRPRLPEEMVTMESFIELTKRSNNAAKNFFCYVVVPVVAITTSAVIIPRVVKIWKLRDIETNRRANMEDLRRTLNLSLRLSSHND